MRAILGQLPPVSGRISVLGSPATRGNKNVGYMPQTRAAPPVLRLSAYDFLASSVNGHRWGVPLLNAAGAREIDRVVAIVGAEQLVRRPVHALSGGDRQRLRIAQALIGSPPPL